MNEHVEYSAKPAGGVTRFLWFCAGADEDILKYSSYADHVKYVGLGGVVLATGVMAALSMGFAIHTIFNGNWYATIPIAIVWSLIVFNLDRFIVSSTGKGDGKDTISGKEFLNALPRLAMAILLGLTISAPLETRIFSREIEREWIETKDQLVQKKVYEIEQLYESRLKEAEKRRDEKKKQLEEQNIIVKENQVRATEERMRGGEGKQWRVDTAALNKSLRTQTLYETQLDSLEKVVLSISPLKSADIDSARFKILSDTSGFLDQIMMLEKLSAEGKRVAELDEATKQVKIGKDNKPVYKVVVPPAAVPIWMVRLLFMIIEIVPVIFKLMLIKSPYDYMSENVNQILEARQGISLQHIPDENNKLHNIKENFNPKRIISIVEHQNLKEEENAKAAITAFADKERKDIEQNPDKYISP